ncbi:MAG: SDR family oxidoreductase [Pseudomonadota bacterium]
MRDQHQLWLGLHRRRVALRGVQSCELRFGSGDELARAFDAARPEVIVNAAGLSDVDACERDPALAQAVNADLAGLVATCAAARGARLVHISTDHVFSGDKPLRSESDAPEPINVYARTKLAGERQVAEHCPQALIVRTNFFGWGHAARQSISDWILAALREGRRLRMFTDAFFTPILATRLAGAVHRLVDAGTRGVIHVGGDERVSKHEFARRLATAFGLPADPIEPARQAEAGLAAPRPRDMSLSNARARGILGGALGALDEQLAELRAQEETGLSRELRRAVTG